MNMRRILCAIAILSFLFCAVQAIHLDITVRDDDDNSRIENAYIYIDDDYVGKTDSYGEFTYSHSEDDPFLLEVKKTGYDDWDETVDEDDTSVNVYLTSDADTLLVYVFDADTIEPVRDARVKVIAESSDENESEWVNSNGEAEFNLIPDETYDLEITASGYETVSRTIEMDSGDTTLRYWLISTDRFSFRVLDADDQSPVLNASVYIDGSLAGTTGNAGVFTTQLLRERNHDIRVESPGYSSFQQNTYIDSDEILMAISLSLSVHPVSVIVYDETEVPVENAAVHIDGSAAGVTDRYGKYTLADVVEGTHTITVAKEGYSTWEETRTIRQDDAGISVELKRETTEVSILVENTDHQVVSGALIYVNGETMGFTDEKGRVREDVSSSGVYNFTAMLEGYRPASVEETIPLGTGAAFVTITLEKEYDIGSLGVFAIAIACVVLLVLGIRWYTGRQYLPPRRRGGAL